MAEASIVQEGVDRFRDAFGSLEDEFQKVQKRLRSQRKDFQKQLDKGRKDLEKRTRRIRTELRKSPALKRIESLRRDATRQLEQGVDNVLGALQIASKSDLQRIDRKISQLSKKLKEMERSKRTNGGAAETVA